MRFCSGLLLSFERVLLLSTAWPRYISGQALSSHSVVSSSRTVRPYSPWGDQWYGHWRTTWSTVCSSVSHSQAAEEAIPHLYKQEQKRSTPVRRRFSRTQAVLGRIIPRELYRYLESKCGVLWGCLATLRSIDDPPTAARLLLFLEKLMSCCAAGKNGCLDLRRRATALDGRVSAEWSRCLGSMARCPKNSAAPLRRSSAG